MRGKGKRYLILRRVLAYTLALVMVLGVWTSVSNAADNSGLNQNVEENTVEEVQNFTEDTGAIVDSSAYEDQQNENQTNADLENENKLNQADENQQNDNQANQTDDNKVNDNGENQGMEDTEQSDKGQLQNPEKESDNQIDDQSSNQQGIKMQDEDEEMTEVQTDGQVEDQTQEADDGTTAEPVALTLSSSGSTTAPAHRKYIKYNGKDSYTLTLDVTGKYDSTLSKPKIDVVLVIDTSGSMNDRMGEKTRLRALKDVVTEKGGLSDSIFNNDQIDARMTVVTYYGLDDEWYEARWDDATWVNKSWATNKTQLDNVVNGVAVNRDKSGTNCQAGLRTAKEALAQARSDARKVVIFLSDGLPTFRYNENGYTVGNGNSDPGNYNANAAYTEASTITGLDQFYTIGFSNSADSRFLSTLVTKVNTTSTSKYYSAANADKLSEAFKQITGSLTEYTCRNVTITDTLSDYAQLEDEEHLNPIVQATANDGSPVDLSNIDIQVTYNTENRTVTAAFPTDYKLQQDVTYSIRFNVKPTAQAYDEYAANEDGYGGNVGSMNSDAPGNDTSSNKPGFYTNDTATLTYTYGTGDAKAETVDYVEKPVLQVDSLTIPVNKVWKNTVAGEQVAVKVELYQDGKLAPYKTLMLNADNQWQSEFKHVAKHHQYQVKEQTIDGFVSAVTGDATTGFTVTNTKLPSLTLSKKVTGEMGDKTKKFPFQITLKDASGNLINGTYSYQGFVREDVGNVTAPKDGTLTFEQGVAEIWLSHGQGITFEKLPLGTSYVIKEKLDESEGYHVSFNGIRKDSTDGILNEDADVTVTNTRENIPVTSVSGLGTSMIPGILLATAALFVLAAISKLFYGKKDKKKDK